MDPAALALEEAMLLERCRRGEAHALGVLVERYQRTIYGFACCLAGSDRDAARRLTVDSFAGAARSEETGPALRLLLVRLIEAGRRITPAPVLDHPRVAGLRSERLEQLRLVEQGLLALPFESRAVLLLRDQLGLPYGEIAAILDVSTQEARAGTVRARLELRERIRQALEGLS